MKKVDNPLTSFPLPNTTKAFLPPCRICGGKASGYHYGANCCQSCRMFFRRMRMGSSVATACLYGGNCIINRSLEKNLCSQCRYQKCLAVGMTHTGKKTGRYSHERLTDYTKEVQNLEVRKMIPPVQGSANILLSEDQREKELDKVIEMMNNVHMKQNQNKNEFHDVFRTLEVIEKERADLEKHFFGKRTPLSKNDYNKVYSSTGIDIDGRRKLMSNILPMFDRSLQRLIEFVPNIPGFKNLPFRDQIALLRSAAPATDMVAYCHSVSKNVDMVIDPDDTSIRYTFHDMAMFHDAHNLDMMKTMMIRMQDLDMTPEEQSVLCAYVIVTSDTELSEEGRDIIIPMIETIEDALYLVIRKKHDNPNRYLIKVINEILFLKSIVRPWKEEYVQLLYDFPDLNWTPSMLYVFAPDIR